MAIEGEDPMKDLYTVPWRDDGDLEINVIGGMLSLVHEHQSLLSAEAWRRVKDYLDSRIAQAIRETTAVDAPAKLRVA